MNTPSKHGMTPYLLLPVVILMIPTVRYFSTGIFDARAFLVASAIACIAPLMIRAVIGIMFKAASKGR